MLKGRHIGVSEKEEAQMLQLIGVKSLDELIDQTIPNDIRLKNPIELPEPLTEHQFAKHIAGIASKNKVYTSYIGQGWYDTVTPAVIHA